MSDDIVERLRWNDLPLDHEAADEIERLRAELALLADAGTGYSQQTLDAVTAERDRLRAERNEAREAARETCHYSEVTGNPPLDGWYAKWPWLQSGGER